MNSLHRLLEIALISSLSIVATTATANIPPDITSFQAVLRDSTQLPLTGSYPIVFRYWSHATSLDAVAYEIGWESHPVVAVNDGLFTVMLGSQPFNMGASGYSGLNINQVFGDFDQVWLQLEVDGDVLLPRIRFGAAPYAFNCTQLQDKGPGEFLRSEGSDNFTGSALYGYTLSFDPGTTLSVGGSFKLGGALVTSSADELNRLDGVGASVTPANLTTLSSGGNANALHVHTNTNAALLGGLSSSQFLRSDASTTFTSGTLATASGTTVSVSGDLQVNVGSTFPRIYFASGEVPRPELRFGTHGVGFGDDRFELSHPLSVVGVLHAGPLAMQAPARAYHYLGDYTKAGASSGYVSDDNDLLVIDDIAAGGRLYAEEQLHVASGNSAARGYSAFGTNTPHSADISTGDDVNISSDLEVDGSLYAVSGIIAGDNSPTTGQIFSSIGEASLQDSALMNGTSDLYVAQDLEVDGSIDVHDIIGPAGNTLQLLADSDIHTMFDNNASGVNVADWYHNGAFTAANKVAELQETGNLRIRGTLSENVAFDLAENFWANDPVVPGEIVATDPDAPGAVRRGSRSAIDRVIGIVSAKPGMLLGGAPFDLQTLATQWGDAARELFATERELMLATIVANHPELQTEPLRDTRLESMSLELFFERHVVPVALAGRVRVKVDTTNGPIAVGDRLTIGMNDGIAARALAGDPVLAIALEPLALGQKELLAFVQSGRDSAVASSATPSAPTPRPSTMSPAQAEPIALDTADVTPLTPTSAAAIPAASFQVIGTIESGDLVSIDRDVPGSVRVTERAFDPSVVGVALAVDPTTRTVSVAVTGVVTCKVDASTGPIEPGDLLTSSLMPGHATRAVVPSPGTIVGKALSRQLDGTGSISVLVMLR